MKISLKKEQEIYIAGQVASGFYDNPDELVRDALYLHSIYREGVIADLRTEIEKGLDSGISEMTVKGIIKSKSEPG